MLHSVDLCAYFADGFAFSTLPTANPAERSVPLSLSRDSAGSGAGDSKGLSLSPAATALRAMGPSGSWAECPDTQSTTRHRKSTQGPRTELFTLLQEAVRCCYAAEDTERDRRERLRHGTCCGEEVGRSGEIHTSSEFAYALAGIRAQQCRRSEEMRRAERAAQDAARAKELPQLVEDAVRYAQQLCTDHSSNAATLEDPAPLAPGFFSVDQMLYARFPPPLLRAAPFAAGVSRLLRWLRTWHEPMDGANGHDYRDAWLRISQSDSMFLPNRLSPSGAPDTASAAYYDEFGNRMRSARLARKLAEQLAVEAEAEAARARRRGYFSRAGETGSGRLSGRRVGYEDALFPEYSSGSDDASESGDEDVTNIAVLHGPCGVGKTAAVYLAAAVLGYRVVEMNTSVRRCPKNIDRLLAELTRSRRLTGRAESGKAMVSIEEELKKLKSEHAAAAAQQSPSPPPAKGKGGNKGNKANAISAAAVAAFFKPRPVATEVIDVDEGGGKPRAGEVVKTESRVHSPSTRKRPRECANIDTSEVKAAGVSTTSAEGTTPASSAADVLPVSNNNNNNNNSSGVGVGGGVDDDTAGRTLLLFEDADVILADETMRPFYTAVRNLAQRSKVPILVTVSSGTTSPAAHTTSMGAAQAAQYFGKQTPFTGMASMPRSALVTQLLVVAAVERGLIACSPESHTNNAMDSYSSSSSYSSPLSCVTVTDVEAFRRISDALRREVYAASDEMHIDVRMWLNRLHCLLLCDQWPETHNPHEKFHTKANGRGNSEEDAEAEGPVSWLMPTCAAMSAGDNDIDRNVLVRSEWDARRGRALSLDSSPVPSPWEWAQFQYAEEISTYGCGMRNGSSNTISNSVIANNTSNSGSPCTNGNGSDGAVEMRNSSGDTSADASFNAMTSADIPAPNSMRGGTPLADNLPSTLREHAEKFSVDDESGRWRCGFTTRDRIEAFGHWWRRTRRSDATRFFVAGRSGNAYEDVVGFGSLLQPVPTGKSG